MKFLYTLRPDNKEGIKMPADVYESIKNEIMELLANEQGLPLFSFFEMLHLRFISLLGENVGWYLYHVKLDLETRGLITVEYSNRSRNKKSVIKKVRKERERGRTVLRSFL